MGACSTLGRVILVILNIIFLLVSLALIAAGSILKFTPSVIMSFLMAGIDTLVPAGIMAGTTKWSDAVPVPSTLNFVPMFGDLGIALLVGGVVLFVLSFLACCGACCKWRPFLIVFVIIMIIIIVALAALGGLFLVKDSILHSNIRDQLTNKMQDEYEADNQGAFSQIMNLLALKMKCCGFSGPEDYAVDWKNHLPVIPKACCINMTTASCMTATDAAVFQEQGCYTKLTGYIEDNKTWAIVALVVLLVLLLLEVIFSIIIVVEVGKDKVGPI